MPLPRALAVPLRWMRRPKVWLALVAGGAGLYTLTGFVILPKVLESQVPKRLSALLGRPVQLQKATFNPYTFALRLEGFAVMEPDGEVLVGFDRLGVEVEATTLLRREIVVDRIALEGFRARYQLLPAGRTNLSDILARLAPPSGAPAPPSASPQPTLPAREPRTFHIRTFALEGARALFEDRSGPEPFRADLGPYSLHLSDFRTQRGSQASHRFTLKGSTGETLTWAGTFGLDPLRSDGTLALERLPLPRYAPYYHPFVGFDLRKGTATLKTAYAFAWETTGKKVRLMDGNLQLADLELAPRSGGPSAVRLARLDVEGIACDLLGNEVRIGAIALEQGTWTLTRAKDGAFNLVSLFTGPKVPPQAKAKLTPPARRPVASKRKKVQAAPAPAAAPFKLRVERLRLRDHQIAFEDRTPASPVRTGLALKRLEAGPFTLDPNGEMPLRLEASLLTGGELRVDGRAKPLQPSFQADVTLQGLNLPPFRPYLDAALKAPMPSGRLTTRLQLEGDFSGPTRLGAHGGLSLAAFTLKDPADGGALLDLPGLQAQGLAFVLAPLSLRIEALAFDRPTARFRLEPGGSNIARALGVAPTPAPAAPPTATAAVPSAATSTPAPAPAPPTPIRIDQLVFKGGSLHFEDATLSPAATVGLEALDIDGRGFSTQGNAASTVRLDTRLDGVAPLAIQGRFNPLAPFADSDLAVQTRGWDLAPSAPYIAKYLGYGLKKGKLDLDVAWKVRQRQLDAENHAKLDQFYLGDKVPSPDAIHAPVKLGLALLRDRHGVIDADIPVAGSLDAPDFKLRKVIWKAIGTLFTKLATSPFDALARLVGAKADLSQAAFRPGTAEADPAGSQALASLAKALQERPALNVEVEGALDLAGDTAALRQEALEALLARTRGTTGPLPAADRSAAVQAAWRAVHPVPKGAKPDPEPGLAAMEQELLAAQTVPADALRALADRRALRAQEALVQAGVDLGRIFRVETKDPKPLAGVRFKVK